MNAEFKAWGSARMRWVEKNEPGVLTDANEYLHGSRLSHTTGYYTNSHCDETAVPAVYTVDKPSVEPWRGSADGDTHHFAAVRDPDNEGCGVVDFEESYADPVEAARAAHGLAERYAESEREYADNEDNKLLLENLLDDVRELRNRHRYLIRALPVAGDDASGARMRSDVRTRTAKLAADIRDLREQIRE